MPQIPLIYGKMDLESDQSSRGDAVLAHLYNGFRVGQSVHMWPRLDEHCDLGTNKPVYQWYSVLHGEHLAVSDGKLFRIVDKVPTEIGHTALSVDVPPAFAEDSTRIFIAAASPINFYTPKDARAYTPRTGEIDPVTSRTLAVQTLAEDLAFGVVGIASTATDGGVVRFTTTEQDATKYHLFQIIDGVTTDAVADPAENPDSFDPASYFPNRTITITGLASGAHTVQLKMVSAADAAVIALSPELALHVQPQILTFVPGVGYVETQAADNAPYFAVGPYATTTDTTATVGYGTGDDHAAHYKLSLSTDKGVTWTELEADEAPGINKTGTSTGLIPATAYHCVLKLTPLSGNLTEIYSREFVVATASAAEAPETTGPLVFTAQPVAKSVTATAITVQYSTADDNANHYKAEYSVNNGATWMEVTAIEKPGADKTLEIPDLTGDTLYLVRIRLTSRPSQGPVGVTSLAVLSGFLVADGTDPNGGGMAGDFAYSDTQGDEGPSYDVWSYENNASKPDALQTIVSTPDDNLFAIGTESVDVSYLSGSVENPFASNKGAAQPFGTPARYSVAYDAQSIYFLSVIKGNRQIVRLIGGREPQIIGFPVDVPVQQVENVADARGFLCGFRGQVFYLITFPTANVTIDDSYHKSLTLAFNIRAEEWAVLGDWDAEAAQYGSYHGCSFAYDQSTRYVGGNWGKIYTLSDTPPSCVTMQHRWRDNGALEWRGNRSMSLGESGERRTPVKQRQCGRYFKRQDEFIFANADTRMAIRTGWRNWGRNVEKISVEYIYDLKRGDAGVVFNGCEENIEVIK